MCRAFTFFGGVPRRISYDNSRIAVSKIIQRRGGALTEAFERLKSYYLFDSHFCLVRRPNEKGHVENLVGYARRNSLVRPGRQRLLDAQRHLDPACGEDLTRCAWGQTVTNAERLACQRPAFLPAPVHPSIRRGSLRPGSTRSPWCGSTPTITRYPSGTRIERVTLRAGIEIIRIECDGQVIAEHRRDWGRYQTVFHWVHYLRLLEHKPGALDYALPLKEVSCPTVSRCCDRGWSRSIRRGDCRVYPRPRVARGFLD